MALVVPQRLYRRARGPRVRGGRSHAEGPFPPHFFVFLLVVAVMGGPARAADLDTAAALLKGGAGALALETLEESPPELGEAGWTRWSRLRVRAFEVLGRWRDVLAVADEMPAKAPSDYRKWLQIRAADLELDHGRPEAARLRAAGLVAAFPESPKVREWLRRVYRAYGAEERTEDARIAVLRHRRGHGKESRSNGERTEQARILAETGASAEALEVLGDSPGTGAARKLRLRLLSEAGRREAAFRVARSWAKESGTAAAWAALAGAARELNRGKVRLRALEQALAASSPQAEVSQVWEAYLQHGELLANKAGLLVGEDGKWLDLAAASQGTVAERALLASVALSGRKPKARRRARLALVDALHAAGLGRSAQRLFRGGPAFREAGSLSPRMLVHLGHRALEDKDLEGALGWMNRVKELPEDVDPPSWWLTRARLRVELAAFHGGAEDLGRILERPAWIQEKGFRDRFMQVVFDLQEADRHGLAVRILDETYRVVSSDQARRELLFWMAESHEGLEEPRKAAALYLRSAAHPPGKVTDPWARTARFRAARALEDTELKADARRLYRGLLGKGSSSQELAVKRRLRRLGGDD